MPESLYHRGPRWRVGHPTHPLPEDTEFHKEQEAVDAAQKLSRVDFQVPAAVCDMETCCITRLFLGGQEFRSV